MYLRMVLWDNWIGETAWRDLSKWTESAISYKIISISIEIMITMIYVIHSEVMWRDRRRGSFELVWCSEESRPSSKSKLWRQCNRNHFVIMNGIGCICLLYVCVVCIVCCSYSVSVCVYWCESSTTIVVASATFIEYKSHEKLMSYQYYTAHWMALARIWDKIHRYYWHTRYSILSLSHTITLSGVCVSVCVCVCFVCFKAKRYYYFIPIVFLFSFCSSTY